MSHNLGKYHRRSIRLPGYDYASAGSYFVTVCVRERMCLMGEVVGEEMQLNHFGQIAHDFWSQVPAHFPNVSIDALVIMPNHLHAIVVIDPASNGVPDAEQGGETPPLQDVGDGDGDGGGAVSAPTLGQILAYYKYQTTKQINEQRNMPGVPLWQRNYWEHIIRNDASLNRIREYIQNNPAHWEGDQLHPDAPPNPFNRGSR